MDANRLMCPNLVEIWTIGTPVQEHIVAATSLNLLSQMAQLLFVAVGRVT
jgi:hypothetical protein